jgi:cardiolipin synthase
MTYSKVTAVGDQKIRLIHGGSEYFELLLKLITEAKISIYLQTYIFDEDETGRIISEALKQASLRKVQVFLLVDGYASSKLSSEFISNLEKVGVHFRMFEPLLKSNHFYFGRRLHHKVLTVDSVYSLVGGMNISNRYNDMPGQAAWLDWAVYAEGNVSIWLTYICQSRISNNVIVKAHRLDKSAFHTKGERVLVKANDWVRGQNQITASYLKMISNANKSIIIMSAYFIPSNQFRKKLRLAAKRGARVQVILAGRSDIKIAKYAERFMYQRLVDNGIEIYEYQKSILHGKIATCDGDWSTVGSYNINGLSAYASIELNLEVKDSHFAAQVEQTLCTIIKSDCLPIAQHQIEQYDFLERFRNACSYYIYRVLIFLFTFYFRRHE